MIREISGRTKTALYLLVGGGATGVAAISLHSTNSEFPFRDEFDGVRRSSRAIYSLATVVFDYKYSLQGFPKKSDEYRRQLSEVHLRSAKRILELCESNKGFYVKAAQFVAALRQVPKEYTSALSSLQDQAVPCDFKAIKQVLVSNLGQDLSDIFLSFDENPIAAASIAQVHHALLKDHQEVAVKVQYPGLEQQLKIDIRTMGFLSKSVAWFFPEYRFEWLVSEFAKAISQELDFVHEAKNSERTSRNFESNNVIRTPHVFWELTTSQILTMQFFRGGKVDDLDYMRDNGINPLKVARALVQIFAEMVFVHGFIHGDPHPGNIFVAPKGPEGFTLVLLDHGIYRELDESFRLDYCELWKALILLDSNKIQELSEKFGVAKYSRYLPIIFTGRTIDSRAALGRPISVEEKRNLKKEVKSLRVEDISSFMESLPPDLLTILRTDGLLRSLISKLGASQRVRLFAYAECAIRGISLKSNLESDSVVRVGFSTLKSNMDYIQLSLLLGLLELISWMEDLRLYFGKSLKQTSVVVRQFLTKALSPFLL